MDAVKLEGHDGSTNPRMQRTDELVATAATVGIVAAGVAMFEAALLPGVILGVAAIWAPQYLPKMVGSLSPLLKSSVRGVRRLARKTKEVVADARGHVHGIVADAGAEIEPKLAEAPQAAHAEPAVQAIEAPKPARKSRKSAK